MLPQSTNNAHGTAEHESMHGSIVCVQQGYQR